MTTITTVNVVRIMAKRAPYASTPIQEETIDLIDESLGKLRGSGLAVAEEIQATLTSVLRDFVAEEDAFLGLLPLLESLLSETLRKEVERAGEGKQFLVDMLKGHEQIGEGAGAAIILGLHFGRDGSVIEALVQALSDSNFRSIDGLAAGRALIRIGPPAVEHLIQGLIAESWPGRVAGATCLGFIGDVRAAAPLVRASADDSPDVRLEAVLALLTIHPEEAFKAEDSVALLKAMNTLAKLEDPEGVDAFIQGLSHESDRIRQIAAKALWKLKDPKTVDPLIQALGDGDINVRQRAANALGDIGDARALDALAQARKDRSWFVRSAAKDLMKRIMRKQS